jgi:hypothetical protein
MEPNEPNQPYPVGQWLTYADAAKLLRIAPESVQRRAQREGWQRQPGNDGRARVLVPVQAVPAPKYPETPQEAFQTLLEGLLTRAIAAEARAVSAETKVELLERELRRWVRRSPAKNPRVVMARLAKLARGR